MFKCGPWFPSSEEEAALAANNVLMMVLRHWRATDNWEDCRRSLDAAVQKGFDEFRAMATELEGDGNRDEVEMRLFMRLFKREQSQDPPSAP